MRGREGAAHEVLVPNGDVENCTAAGYMEPFMQVRDVEVWIERREVDGNLTYTVCSVD